MQIRKATPKDFKDVKKILIKTGFGNEDIKDVKNIINNAGLSLVILINNRIIGTISGHYHDFKPEVEQIGVLPDYQGKGYGLKLIKMLENEFKKLGERKIYAEGVEFKNIGFYIKAGYRKINKNSFIKKI